MTIRAAIAVLLLAAALGAIQGAAGQSYPVKPIRIVDAFPPGGGSDYAARLISGRLGEALGQQAIVENRGGANGIIGMEFVSKAPPDGYVIAIANNSTLAINPHLYRKVPYDPLRDFAPITMVGAYPYFLVVHPTVPARSVKELIALAKAHPGKLNFASAGSALRLINFLFNSVAGVHMTDVPYNGSAPALIDLLGGHVDLMLSRLPLGHFKTGKLRALAVTGARRSVVEPELPTVAEAGLPGFEVSAWYGLVAPRDTPKDVIARLHAEVVKVLATDAIRTGFRNVGVEVIGNTPEEFGAQIRSELARWGKVVKDSGIPLL